MPLIQGTAQCAAHAVSTTSVVVQCASAIFLDTTTSPSHPARRILVMTIQNTLLNAIGAATQSTWLRQTPLMLAIVATVLVMSGCTPHH